MRPDDFGNHRALSCGPRIAHAVLVVNGRAASISAILFFIAVLRAMDRSKSFYLFVGMGMILASWTARLHEGSFENMLMPAYAILSIIFTLAMQQFLSKAAALYAVCIAQMLILEYDPRKQIPAQKDLEAGRKFIKILRSIDGESYAPKASPRF